MNNLQCSCLLRVLRNFPRRARYTFWNCPLTYCKIINYGHNSLPMPPLIPPFQLVRFITDLSLSALMPHISKSLRIADSMYRQIPLHLRRCSPYEHLLLRLSAISTILLADYGRQPIISAKCNIFYKLLSIIIFDPSELSSRGTICRKKRSA